MTTTTAATPIPTGQTLLDDYSPLITYSGEWNSTHSNDIWTPLYQNGTYHSTLLAGCSLTFTWNGGDVGLYGARRPNHGYYSVSVDSGSKIYLQGYLDPGYINMPLYTTSGLARGDHTITMTNEWDYNGGTAARSALDLDYILYQDDSGMGSTAIPDPEPIRNPTTTETPQPTPATTSIDTPTTSSTSTTSPFSVSSIPPDLTSSTPIQSSSIPTISSTSSSVPTSATSAISTSSLNPASAGTTSPANPANTNVPTAVYTQLGELSPVTQVPQIAALSGGAGPRVTGISFMGLTCLILVLYGLIFAG